jgi:hypothetical protein
LQETATLDHLVLSGLDQTNLQAIVPDLIAAELCPSLLELKFNNTDPALLTSLQVGTVRNSKSPSMRVAFVADAADSEDATHELMRVLQAAGVEPIILGNATT